MSVTVIIVSWNSGDYLRECLRSLKMQTVAPDHVLLVDNGGTGEDPAGSDEYAGIVLLKMKENLGFAAGNNRALEACDTEFVALLNPDAFPAPEWLERLLAAAHSQPDATAFGCRQLCYNKPNILDGIGDIYHMSGLAWRAQHGAGQQACDLVEREIFSPCAAAALYRREALSAVGGFDEDFFCYHEDVDLGFRLRLAGHKAVYVPDAVVHHVGSAATGGQNSDFAVYHGFRNQVWTFVKNMPGALFWLLLPLHVVLNLASIAVFAMGGQGTVILKAKRDALLGIPRMWRKRRGIQAGRIASSSAIWRVLDKRVFKIGCTSN